jgi:hypothetical protein
LKFSIAQASLQVPHPEHFSWITVGIMDDAPLIMVGTVNQHTENPWDAGFFVNRCHIEKGGEVKAGLHHHRRRNENRCFTFDEKKISIFVPHAGFFSGP